MFIRKLVFSLVLLSSAMSASAQEEVTVETTPPQTFDEKPLFKHLDVSVTGGTMGIGLDLSTTITDMVKVRAGVEFMPKFQKTVNFGVQVGEKKADQTEEEYLSESQSKFEKLSGLLTAMTGQKVDNNVDMIGEPSFVNFKCLVDVFPFKANKKWHFTAGFYWGTSRIAKAYNTTEDMPTLFSVNMYNVMYHRLVEEPDYYFNNDFLPGFGSLDPFQVMALSAKFSNYGRMGLHIGDFKSGEPYMMEPDEDCMVKATIKTNSFKPYLGFGYGTDLSKKSSQGWNVSFDAGLLFWGGSPSIIAHDGTDFVKDLKNVRGKVGRYVDLIKGFVVYPVVQLRLTKTIF